MKTRNQHDDVLQYLQEHSSGITQMDAYRKFEAPITRLAAIICDLREQGYNILSNQEKGSNCYGTNQYVRYTLVNSPLKTE